MKKILLITIGILALNTICRAQQPAKETNDAVIYRQLEQLARQMDPGAKNSTLSGTLRITQLGAGLKAQPAVPVLFSKKGGAFYYRLGETETLNADGIYIYIDHKLKQVLVANQKKIEKGDQVTAIADMAARIREEDYRPIAEEKDNIRTLRFINDQHPSCKEYAIAYNKQTMAIKSIFIRLADPYNPQSVVTGQTVDLRVKSWKKEAVISAYLKADDVLRRNGHAWRLINNYKNYRLIEI